MRALSSSCRTGGRNCGRVVLAGWVTRGLESDFLYDDWMEDWVGSVYNKIGTFTELISRNEPAPFMSGDWERRRYCRCRKFGFNSADI